jgi:hypothetical protein
MQWMCKWMFPYNITAALLHQAFGSHLEFWVTLGPQMMVMCGDWGCGPNQNWSHINVKPMQCVWQTSYAVDVHINASLNYYSHSPSPSFWKSPRILGNSWATNDGEVQWLRLWTQSRLIDPISMSNPCNVFDKLHMQWMCIWMCPYNITSALLHQAFWSHLVEFWVTLGPQMMVKCGDWGCGPNQNCK